MERRRSDPGATRFWYIITFLAGLYWSIILLNGSFDELFIVWSPGLLCVAGAFRLVGRIRTHIIGEILNLLAMFGIGVGVGRVLQRTGTTQLFRDRLQFF